MTDTQTLRPKPIDRAALGLTIVIGAGVIVWTLVQTLFRLIQVLSNRDVPVAASFTDTKANLPVGPGGAEVPVTADQVTILVSDMPVITVVSLVLAQLAYAITVVVTVTCVCLVIRNLNRGRAFTTGNVGLVGVITLAVGFGYLATWLFTTMGANGASTALAGAPGANTAVRLDFLVVFAISSLGALAVAFTAGNRLQRETEGLV